MIKSRSGKDNEPESPPARAAGIEQKWWVLLAIGLSTFMSALDGSITNISLPTISADFGTDVTRIEWVVTIYLLVVSGLLLSFGRLGDLRGHKQVFITGFVIFIVSSIFCALAVNTLMLVAARGVQALGAAMLMANSPAILTKSFPSAQRGQALGLQATMTYLGLTVGPSLGGWLTNEFGWRSVFYVNIPVGLLAVWASLRFIRADAGNQQAERFDLLGAGLFLTGLVALLLGFNQGHVLGWTSLPIMALLASAAVLLVAFLLVEQRVPAPMLDLSLFKQRIFSLAVTSAIFNYIAVNITLFLMPFYLIQARQFDPGRAGLIMTSQPIIMALVAPFSGTLSDRMGSRSLSTFGMAVMALGLFLLSRLGPTSSIAQITTALAVAGLGTGTFISPNNSALMGSAPRHRQGIAAGILATARNVGMALGVGLGGAIFSTWLALNANASGVVISPALGPVLYTAFTVSFLAAAGFALAGAITSASRV